MAEQRTPTSGKAWRENVDRGVVVELPSGLIARVRGVSSDVVFTLGSLPDELTPLIADIVDGKELNAGAIDITFDLLRKSKELVRAVCQAALLEPRLVDNPQADDEIGWEHLDDYDRQFLFKFLGVGTRQLELFRLQQALDVDRVDIAEGYPTPGEPDISDTTVDTRPDGA